MDLSQLRQQIDTIDRQIVNLYEERMDVSRQVAEYKIETGKKVFDKLYIPFWLERRLTHER